MIWLNDSQIAEFVKHYPPLEALLVSDDHQALKEEVPRLIAIRIARIDETLLYFHGDYVDGERSYLSQKEDTLAGKRLERIFVYGTNNEIIGSTSGKERGVDGKSFVRVKDIIGKDPNLVQYIIVLSRTVWYAHNKENVGFERFGKLESVEKEVVIYRMPSKMKGGIARIIERARLDENVILSTGDLTEGLILNEPEFKEVSVALNALAKHFVDAVYNMGLRSRIDKSKSKGMSGMFGSVKMLSYTMAGRVMLTLSRGDIQITFIAAEDGDPR
ncbi:MAG: hypothetical protein WCW78_02570, partial [Candidatus Paceibacterota bacterium]